MTLPVVLLCKEKKDFEIIVQRLVLLIVVTGLSNLLLYSIENPKRSQSFETSYRLYSSVYHYLFIFQDRSFASW